MRRRRFFPSAGVRRALLANTHGGLTRRILPLLRLPHGFQEIGVHPHDTSCAAGASMRTGRKHAALAPLRLTGSRLRCTDLHPHVLRQFQWPESVRPQGRVDYSPLHGVTVSDA